ncbi:MAG: hypothetical protein RL536_54 [Candidatus Parcubacteria bacterium]|jgi:DNA-3-methyladenine glycosylase II
MYHLAKEHFKKFDQILYKAACLHNIKNITRSRDVFRDLVSAVTGQQLSGKAADTIFGRLETLVGRTGMAPRSILKLRIEAMRKCGLSNAKAKTIRTIAKAVIDKKLNLINIHKHDDKTVVELLTSVKGIGPWTVEMILMFSLGRTDIFSKGLEDVLVDVVKSGKIIYSGTSAGSMIASSDLKLSSYDEEEKDLVQKTNDFSGLGLVNFLIIPHTNNKDFAESNVSMVRRLSDNLQPLIFLDDNRALWVENGKLEIVKV